MNIYKKKTIFVTIFRESFNFPSYSNTQIENTNYKYQKAQMRDGDGLLIWEQGNTIITDI